jgi:hypothetical protein
MPANVQVDESQMISPFSSMDPLISWACGGNLDHYSHQWKTHTFSESHQKTVTCTT